MPTRRQQPHTGDDALRSIPVRGDPAADAGPVNVTTPQTDPIPQLGPDTTPGTSERAECPACDATIPHQLIERAPYEQKGKKRQTLYVYCPKCSTGHMQGQELQGGTWQWIGSATRVAGPKLVEMKAKADALAGNS